MSALWTLCICINCRLTLENNSWTLLEHFGLWSMVCMLALSSRVLAAGASAMFAKWAYEFQSHTNQLPLFDQQKSNKAGGDPNIRYYHS